MFPINEINAIELSSKMDQNDGKVELVDIRTPAEVARGVIPDAKVLPMHLIPLKLDYFSTSDKQFVIYCRTGSRSAQACMFLNQQGISNVINLRGGIMSWAQQGYAIDHMPAGKIS